MNFLLCGGFGEIFGRLVEQADERFDLVLAHAREHALFHLADVLADLLLALLGLFGELHAAAAMVGRVGEHRDEALGFEPLQNAGDGGMGEGKLLFDVFGVDDLAPVHGQIAQHERLRAGEIERRDGPVHVLRDRLIQKAQPGTEMMGGKFHGAGLLKNGSMLHK